jgi:hypothetical protein
MSAALGAVPRVGWFSSDFFSSDFFWARGLSEPEDLLRDAPDDLLFDAPDDLLFDAPDDLLFDAPEDLDRPPPPELLEPDDEERLLDLRLSAIPRATIAPAPGPRAT